MTTTIEIRVLELLCSRLCHELIGPVSALSNGVELLGDDPGDMVGDIISLLAQSSGQASQRLKFYRIAYGFGGDTVQALGLGDVGSLVQGLAEEENVTLSWPEGGEALGRSATKVLLNGALMALEALPRGGAVDVQVASGDSLDITITATGEGAGLWEESVAALETDAPADALTPRSVQAYFTAYLTQAAGGSLRHHTSPGGAVVLSAGLPKSV